MIGYNSKPNRSLSDAYSKVELNLVQLRVEEEKNKQIQDQNHSRLSPDIGNKFLEEK